MKKISVIIVNYNVRHFLQLCLHSVQRAAKGIDAEIIVVDNNSSDDSLQMLQSDFPDVRLIANKVNTGFSKANNQAVAAAKGEYILFLNPDTVMPEDFLHKTIAYLDAHPRAGALGPRLIDGKGAFAPDGKKSFPTLSVALFKTSGINKLFPRSPFFNKYYAVHIGERQTAPAEVLSGCCMMVRSSVLQQIGGAFDEDYFMYCEDVDLSYRITKAGYENIYFPEVDLVHYKGESTRKASLSYIRIFNEALTTFVRKHYTKTNAALFILFINAGIVLRAVWAGLKVFFKWVKTPAFDAAALLLLLVTMNNVWVEGVKHRKPIEAETLYVTFPAYILLWILSIYVNGGYDKPYRPLRVVRGMVVGTIIILAYFGILSAEYRYSRAVILFTGVLGALGITGLRELLHWTGLARTVKYNRVPKKAVIVAEENRFADTAALLKKVHYAPDIVGRIEPSKNGSAAALARLQEMKPLLHTLNIDEVVFCINGLQYAEVLQQMQTCGPSFEYKIHLPGSSSFVGSNSGNTAGDLYTTDKRYQISTFVSARNKRMFDIGAALMMLLLSPILFFAQHEKQHFFGNIFAVLWGTKTWISYMPEPSLPKIKPGILPPYTLQANYDPSASVQQMAAANYAEQYVLGLDFNFLLKNIRFAGKKAK